MVDGNMILWASAISIIVGIPMGILCGIADSDPAKLCKNLDQLPPKYCKKSGRRLPVYKCKEYDESTGKPVTKYEHGFIYIAN